MTSDDIKAEFDKFIEFPVGGPKTHVTVTSTLLFAEHIAAIAAEAESKRIHDEGMVTVGHMRERIAAEREACAKLLEEKARQCTKGSMNEYIITSNAQAIRAGRQP